MKQRNIIFIFTILTIAVLLYSCGSDSNSSGPSFTTGTSFIGTYQVQPDPLTPAVIDTMYFSFGANNTFSMRLLTSSYLSGVDTIFLGGDTITDGVIEINGDTIVDNDRTYCDIRNVSYQFVTYADSVIVTVPSNYSYLETCNHDYNPGDAYRYNYQGNDIMLIGDDDAINRRIILWSEIAIRIKN